MGSLPFHQAPVARDRGVAPPERIDPLSIQTGRIEGDPEGNAPPHEGHICPVGKRQQWNRQRKQPNLTTWNRQLRMQIEKYPERVRMSGLPFMLQGWNCVFHKSSRETSDGRPVYRLRSYTLYWLYPIIGVRMLREKGSWHLKRDCDDRVLSDLRKLGGPEEGDDDGAGGDLPMGHWTYGAAVTEVVGPKSCGTGVLGMTSEQWLLLTVGTLLGLLLGIIMGKRL